MSMSATLGPHLPYLRRYARALTGSQVEGDAYVRIMLELLANGKAILLAGLPPRIALYHLFHNTWSDLGEKYPTATVFASTVERRLHALAPQSREVLLLTTLEEFSLADAATILALSEAEVEASIEDTLIAIDRDLASEILIIEDEMLIALDLENLVQDLGHGVVGIATTRDEAVRIALERKPDLILADIQLADESSGVDAVVAIRAKMEIPAIFITAFPKRLLSGDRPEPTYLITKPFAREMVRATIGQALFFHKPMATRE